MTYKELTVKLADDTGLTQTDVDRVLDALTGTVHSQMARGGEVAIPALGKFSTSPRAARQGRNPQTGETITIPATTAVRFSAAKALKDAAKG